VGVNDHGRICRRHDVKCAIHNPAASRTGRKSKADGRTLARLYADEQGPHFELRDNQGVAVVKLGVGSSGGNVVIVKRLVEHGPPDAGFVVVDETYRPRARLTVSVGAFGAGVLMLENVSKNTGYALLPIDICHVQGHSTEECLH